MLFIGRLPGDEMKILFVAMASSIHTARWVAQFAQKDWDMRLFPSLVGELEHPLLPKNVSIFRFAQGSRPRKGGLTSFCRRVARRMFFAVARRFIEGMDEKMLERAIRRFKPDIVHSMETQAAGYLVERVRSRHKGRFPVWIHTNWGSDLYVYGRVAEHKEQIGRVLALCDFYSCECHRDVRIALEAGLKGRVLPVFPNTGGFDLATLGPIRNRTRTSQRKRIMVKGYHGWAGRALVALRALERCADLLSGYEILIYSGGSQEVQVKAALLKNDYALNITMLPPSDHATMLELQAGARISIGMSLGDAISTAFLEAFVMGSFPIQSDTSCAGEWIESGVGGILVGAEDPDALEAAVRRALADDALVDRAAEINWASAVEKLDAELLRNKSIEFYESALAQGPKEMWKN